VAIKNIMQINKAKLLGLDSERIYYFPI